MPKRKNKHLRKHRKKQERLNDWFAEVAHQYGQYDSAEITTINHAGESPVSGMSTTNNARDVARDNFRHEIHTSFLKNSLASWKTSSGKKQGRNMSVQGFVPSTQRSIQLQTNLDDLDSLSKKVTLYFHVLSDARYCICCNRNPYWAYECLKVIHDILRRLHATENISLPDRIVESISSVTIKLDLLKKECFAFNSVSTEQMIDPLIELDRIYYESYYHYSTVHDVGNSSKGILQPIDYLSVYDRCLTLQERLRENRAKFFNHLSKSCRKKKAIELSYNLVTGEWDRLGMDKTNNPLLQILQHSVDESIMFLDENCNLDSNSNQRKISSMTRYEPREMSNLSNDESCNTNKQMLKKRKKKKRRRNSSKSTLFGDKNYAQISSKTSAVVANDIDNGNAETSNSTGYGTGGRAKPMVDGEIERWRNHQREWACRLYAYATPDNATLNYLKKHGPLVEVGAGTGYWASLLLSMSSNEANSSLNDVNKKAMPIITPFDKYAGGKDGENLYHQDTRRFTKVLSGDECVLKNKKFENHTLFLCYPPPDSNMAYECVKGFKGQNVVYIGEFEGTTGNLKFEKYLFTNFRLSARRDLPKFPDQNCMLTVWRRRKKSIPSPISKHMYLASWPLACSHCGAKGIPGVVKLRRCKICRTAIYCSESCFREGLKYHFSLHRIGFCGRWTLKRMGQRGFCGNNVDYIELGTEIEVVT